MTIFQTISIIFSFFLLAGGLVGIWIKSKIDIAKLQIRVLSLEKEFHQAAINMETIRKENRDDHAKLFDKFDKFQQTLLEEFTYRK